MALPAGSALDAEVPDQSRDGHYTPARVLQVELTEPLPRLDPDERYRQAFVLARLHTEPLGACMVPLPDEGVSPGQLAALLWQEVREPVTERFAAAGLPVPAALPAGGLAADPAVWPFLLEREAVLADPPFISIVIPTRARPEQLKDCLNRLNRQRYSNFEIVVVDNAPESDAVERLVKGHVGSKAPVRYCREPRPGVSWARNAGVAAAASDLIAFVDDDDDADEYWLSQIAVAFARSDRIGCISGMIVPARLDTAAEGLFELIGGHIKGRGFVRDRFSREGPQSPLFPLPPFGTGANMAFRREVLDKIGGFDVALGTGTPSGASEDSLAMTLTMLEGFEIAYEPAVLVWHHHRPDMESLSRQLHGYSVGLTAYYAALIRHRPGVLPDLLKLLPAALVYMKGTVTAPGDSPENAEGLDRRHLQGMLSGPFAYVRSVLRQRRAARLG